MYKYIMNKEMKLSVLRCLVQKNIFTLEKLVQKTQSSWITCQFKLSHILGVHVGWPCESEN